MGLFKFIADFLNYLEDIDYHSYSENDTNQYKRKSYSFNCDINPATGLPMIGGVDAAGNPYGLNDNDYLDSD